MRTNTYLEIAAKLHRSIRDLELPYFQRDLVWDERRAMKLYDSILKGYPIGSVIFWKPRYDRALVIDGQQRITAVTGRKIGSGEEVFPIRWDVDKEEITFEDKGLTTPKVWENIKARLAWYSTAMEELGEEKVIKFLNLRDRWEMMTIPVYVFETLDIHEVAEAFCRLNNEGVRITKKELERLLRRTKL